MAPINDPNVEGFTDCVRFGWMIHVMIVQERSNSRATLGSLPNDLADFHSCLEHVCSHNVFRFFLSGVLQTSAYQVYVLITLFSWTQHNKVCKQHNYILPPLMDLCFNNLGSFSLWFYYCSGFLKMLHACFVLGFTWSYYLVQDLCFVSVIYECFTKSIGINSLYMYLPFPISIDAFQKYADLSICYHRTRMSI